MERKRDINGTLIKPPTVLSNMYLLGDSVIIASPLRVLVLQDFAS